MTDEQINRTIAESLEPDPQSLGSNARFWHWAGDLMGWVPREFTNDPALRDLLQGKLIEELWSIRIQKLQDCYEMECESETEQRAFTVSSLVRGNLESLAFLRAHNLDPNRREG